jgi:hypothetical protein
MLQTAAVPFLQEEEDCDSTLGAALFKLASSPVQLTGERL